VRYAVNYFRLPEENMNQLLVSAFVDELEKLAALSKTVAGQPGGLFESADKTLSEGIPKVQGPAKAPLTNLTGKAKSYRQTPLAETANIPSDVPITSTVQSGLDTSASMADQDKYQKELKASLTGKPAKNTITLKGITGGKASGSSSAAVNSAVTSSPKGTKV
jgi:hypothetical protein